MNHRKTRSANPFEESDEERIQRIFNSATPAFLEVVHKLDGLYRKTSEVVIRNHYEIGQLLLEIQDDARTNQSRKYGYDPIPRLERVLGWSASTIRCDLKLAESFTPEQIQELCELRTANGQSLGYRHLTYLCEYKPERRKEKLDWILRENITVEEFGYELVREHNKEPGQGPGRPLKAPRDFNGVLRQQLSFAKDFENRNHFVWSNTQHSLEFKWRQLASDSITDERTAEVKQLAEMMRRVAIEASKRADEAEAVYRRCSEILENRNKSEKTLAIGKDTGGQPTNSDSPGVTSEADLLDKIPLELPFNTLPSAALQQSNPKASVYPWWMYRDVSPGEDRPRESNDPDDIEHNEDESPGELAI